VFSNFLKCTVNVANRGHTAYNPLSIHLQHVLENAVSRRVCGPEVQRYQLVLRIVVHEDRIIGCYSGDRFTHCNIFYRPKEKSFLSTRFGSARGYSLRIGKTSRSSIFSIRLRSGWPSNLIPKKSYVSRSIQSAPCHTVVAVGITGLVPSMNTLIRNLTF